MEAIAGIIVLVIIILHLAFTGSIMKWTSETSKLLTEILAELRKQSVTTRNGK